MIAQEYIYALLSFPQHRPVFESNVHNVIVKKISSEHINNSISKLIDYLVDEYPDSFNSKSSLSGCPERTFLNEYFGKNKQKKVADGKGGESSWRLANAAELYGQKDNNQSVYFTNPYLDKLKDFPELFISVNSEGRLHSYVSLRLKFLK